MKKHYVIAFLFCCIAAMLCAGGKKDSSTVAQAKSADNSSAQAAYTVKVVVPANAPAICIAKMASDAAAVADSAVTEYEVLQAPDMLQARLLSGEADIAIVPSNLSAILYAKGTGQFYRRFKRKNNYHFRKRSYPGCHGTGAFKRLRTYSR